MVSEAQGAVSKNLNTSVLILVLVEDGLGDLWQWYNSPKMYVLILVLVEDGLGEIANGYQYNIGGLS